MSTEHLIGEVTPEEASVVLVNIGVEEDSYDLIMTGHPSLDGLSGHELKAMVVVARSEKPLDYSEVYFQMKEQFPQD